MAYFLYFLINCILYKILCNYLARTHHTQSEQWQLLFIIIIIIIIIIILYIDSKVAVCRLGAIAYTIYPPILHPNWERRSPAHTHLPLNSAHCPPHFLFLTTPLHILCCGSARKVAKICLGNIFNSRHSTLSTGVKIMSCEVLNISWKTSEKCLEKPGVILQRDNFRILRELRPHS